MALAVDPCRSSPPPVPPREVKVLRSRIGLSRDSLLYHLPRMTPFHRFASHLLGNIAAPLCLMVSGRCLGDDRILKADLFVGGGDQWAPTASKSLRLNSPFGVNFDSQGNAYVIEMTGHRVLKIERHGDVKVLAGNGEKGSGGDGGLGTTAQVNGPHALALTREGDLLFADTFGNRLRAIDTRTGIIRAVAGTGVAGFSGDGGPAVNAQSGGVYGISLDASERHLYLTDLDHRRIRRLDLKTGFLITVAGNGRRGVPTDGSLAVDAPLVDPRSVTVDRKGNLFILERGGNALRQVDAQGRIRTVVGRSGQAGFSGDGGDGQIAQLNGAKDVGMDRDGSVLIADSDNHSVRRYNPRSGKISRVAGTGVKGSAGVGGDARECQLNQPHGVWVHPKTGDIYISDSSNNRILRLHP